MKKFGFVSVVAFMFTSSVQARDGNYVVHMIRCEGQLGDKDIPVERQVTSMGKVVLRSGSSGAVRVGFRVGMGDELAEVTHSCEAEVLQKGELVDMHVTLEKKITAVTASANNCHRELTQLVIADLPLGRTVIVPFSREGKTDVWYELRAELAATTPNARQE